jgi:adenosine kinase
LDRQDVHKVAIAVANLPREKKNRPRVVAVTNGSDSIVVGVSSFNKNDSYSFVVDAKRVPREMIKDTNGCGDSFVGGFLAKIA